METLFLWTGAVIWGAMIGFCWLIACIAIPYLLIGFVSKAIAAWVFIGKGRVELEPGWTRAGAALSLAWDHFLSGEFTYHSGNEWLASLEYTHPLKWKVYSRWDYMAAEDEDDEEAA